MSFVTTHSNSIIVTWQILIASHCTVSIAGPWPWFVPRSSWPAFVGITSLVFWCYSFEATTTLCHYQRLIASSHYKGSSTTSTTSNTANISTCSICTNSNTPISSLAPPHSPSALPPPLLISPATARIHLLHHLHFLHYLHQLQNSSRCFLFLPLLCIEHCSRMYCTPWCPYCFYSVLTSVRHSPLLNTARHCNLTVMILTSVVSTEWRWTIFSTRS